MFILNIDNISNNARDNLSTSENLSASSRDPDILLQTTILKGDVDKNGEVNPDDYYLLDRYLHSKDDPVNLDDEQKQYADINGDNRLSEHDLYEIGTVLYQKLYDSVKVNHNMAGDFNSDGKIDELDLSMLSVIGDMSIGLGKDRNLTEEYFNAADLNKDGIVNKKDLNELKLKISNDKPSDNSEELARPPASQVRFGDLNSDGVFDYADQKILIEFFNGGMKEDKLTPEQKQAADVDSDGRVGFQDFNILINELPHVYFQSINPGMTPGDLNDDTKVDKNDLKYFLIAEDYDYHGALPEEIKPLFDIDQNGKVNRGDIDIFRNLIMNEPEFKIDFKPQTENNPNNWMVSQFRGPSNLNAGSSMEFNGNCAPAALLMVARMLGKVGGGEEEAQEQILALRELAGQTDEYSGFYMFRTAQAAEKIGLNAELANSNIDQIINSLGEGKKVIVSVNPACYSVAEDTTHAIVISAVEGDKFTVYDPGFQKPLTISEQALKLALGEGSGNMLILGNPKENKTSI